MVCTYDFKVKKSSSFFYLETTYTMELKQL